MKKNILFKAIITFFCIISFIGVFNINQYVYASSLTTKTDGGIGEEAVGVFMNKSQDNIDNGKETITTLKDFLGAIRNVFQIVSMGVAIIMLAVLAMKYMVSSVEEKAEIKKHAFVYVLGAILIFATNGIISIIKAFSSNID